jgi:hypothetical protein
LPIRVGEILLLSLPRVTPLIAQFFFTSRQSSLARVTRFVNASITTLPPSVITLHLVTVIAVNNNDNGLFRVLRE